MGNYSMHFIRILGELSELKLEKFSQNFVGSALGALVNLVSAGMPTFGSSLNNKVPNLK
jgi:hypothetical protein